MSPGISMSRILQNNLRCRIQARNLVVRVPWTGRQGR
jgi:hypothetical protein